MNLPDQITERLKRAETPRDANDVAAQEIFYLLKERPLLFETIRAMILADFYGS